MPDVNRVLDHMQQFSEVSCSVTVLQECLVNSPLKIWQRKNSVDESVTFYNMEIMHKLNFELVICQALLSHMRPPHYKGYEIWSEGWPH